jgi:hypothetical protein
MRQNGASSAINGMVHVIDGAIQIKLARRSGILG